MFFAIKQTLCNTVFFAIEENTCNQDVGFLQVTQHETQDVLFKTVTRNKRLVFLQAASLRYYNNKIQKIKQLIPP